MSSPRRKSPARKSPRRSPPRKSPARKSPKRAKKSRTSTPRKLSPRRSPTRKSPKRAGKSRRSASPRKLTGAEKEHQLRYCRCLESVRQKQPNVNKFAICTASVGRVTNSCKQFGFK